VIYRCLYAFLYHRTSLIFATLSSALGILTSNELPVHTLQCSTLMSLSEMENSQCVNPSDPHSAKPALWKGHRTNWIKEVKYLHTHCKLECLKKTSKF
jgi:hypothetical protein